MISFVLKGGVEPSRRFLSALEIFACAESLGGVESLAEHPAIMTHASVPAEQRKALGIDDGLVRLSVGVEGPDDLWADVERALDAA
jgi:cystathionine gamma-synthase/cystathionine gamma-lyase